MKKFFLAVLSSALLMVNVAQADDAERLIKENLQKVDPRIQVTAVADAPIKGTHEVELNSGEFVYADSKGEYFLIGQLYRYSDEEGFVNLTEEKRKVQRLGHLGKVSDENMVIFPAEGERKTTVNIFTDVDCPYCRKMHEEVPKLTAMGVQVNYLAFPRQGPNSQAYHTMVSIWCAQGADGKREAMTDAKQGAAVDAATCDNPVLEQLSLGQMVGVTGTPAMVLEDGTLLPGYMPAARLSKILGL